MISILIPTLNRSDFLTRALHYYSKVGFKGYVCIGDSSNAQHAEKTKHALQALEGKLRIIYRSFPNPPYTHDGMVMKELIELAPTPYAVFAGDDDFVIPNGLEQCAVFLDAHPEYSAVHGVRIAVRLKSSGAFGQLASAWYAGQPILEHQTASERWAEHIRCPLSVQYSVHRTETWRRMYRDVGSVPLRYLGTELLPCSISAILGKVKELSCLSLVYQENESPIFSWDTHSLYSLIVHPDWSQSVGVLRDCIVEALAQQDGIDVNKAQEIVDRALWCYIFLFLQWQYLNRYGASKNPMKQALKHVPGLVALVRFLRQRIRTPSEPGPRISLDSLLNPSSPFYADFMPVYRTIMDGVPELV